MNELTTLASISKLNRASFRTKASQTQKQRDRTTETTATILGYDSATGNYRVQNADGKIISARAISNSSALHKGASVSLVSPQGGTPIIDAMPR
jgi:hypothetical protein